jgi:hypothetical protein
LLSGIVLSLESSLYSHPVNVCVTGYSSVTSWATARNGSPRLERSVGANKAWPGPTGGFFHAVVGEMLLQGFTPDDIGKGRRRKLLPRLWEGNGRPRLIGQIALGENWSGPNFPVCLPLAGADYNGSLIASGICSLSYPITGSSNKGQIIISRKIHFRLDTR